MSHFVLGIALPCSLLQPALFNCLTFDCGNFEPGSFIVRCLRYLGYLIRASWPGHQPSFLSQTLFIWLFYELIGGNLPSSIECVCVLLRQPACCLFMAREPSIVIYELVDSELRCSCGSFAPLLTVSLRP